MEARVAKLEAVVPTLATKEDLMREVSGLRVEMHKEFTAQTWRIVGWGTGLMIALNSALVAAVYFVARNVH